MSYIFDHLVVNCTSPSICCVCYITTLHSQIGKINRNFWFWNLFSKVKAIVPIFAYQCALLSPLVRVWQYYFLSWLSCFALVYCSPCIRPSVIGVILLLIESFCRRLCFTKGLWQIYLPHHQEQTEDVIWLYVFQDLCHMLFPNCGVLNFWVCYLLEIELILFTV